MDVLQAVFTIANVLLWTYSLRQISKTTKGIRMFQESWYKNAWMEDETLKRVAIPTDSNYAIRNLIASDRGYYLCMSLSILGLATLLLSYTMKDNGEGGFTIDTLDIILLGVLSYLPSLIITYVFIMYKRLSDVSSKSIATFNNVQKWIKHYEMLLNVNVVGVGLIIGYYLFKGMSS